jgi:hypothetical protein
MSSIHFPVFNEPSLCWDTGTMVKANVLYSVTDLVRVYPCTWPCESAPCTGNTQKWVEWFLDKLGTTVSLIYWMASKVMKWIHSEKWQVCRLIRWGTCAFRMPSHICIYLCIFVKYTFLMWLGCLYWFLSDFSWLCHQRFFILASTTILAIQKNYS